MSQKSSKSEASEENLDEANKGKLDEAQKEKIRDMIKSRFEALHSLKEQKDQLDQNLEKIGEKINHITEVIQNLKEINTIEKGAEILVPVSSGVFIKTKMEDNKKFLVNVGANTVIEKDISGIEEIMLNQKEELTSLKSAMSDDVEKIEANMINLQREIKSMM